MSMLTNVKYAMIPQTLIETKELDITTKMIYMCLLVDADRESKVLVTNNEIAKWLNISRVTVSKKMKVLEEHNYLTRELKTLTWGTCYEYTLIKYI